MPNEKREVVKEIKEAAARASEIYLATDPDREGEAIAWHLMASRRLDESRASAGRSSTRSPRKRSEASPTRTTINMSLVNAQQARRILDRLVGYNITELLWQKVRNRLSAGRVQSVALRMVVDREREIRTFVPVEYWTIQAELAKQVENGRNASNFVATLIKIRDEDADLHTDAEVMPHTLVLENSDYRVEEVKRGTRQRRPAPPFTTSTLQQEASRTLNFNAGRTMRVAQQLYEGIDTGEGQIGLITYMRTDSTDIAKEAQAKAHEFIVTQLRQGLRRPRIPRSTRHIQYPPRKRTRPSGVPASIRTPEGLHVPQPGSLRLYTLIWQRFVASQMANAVL